MQPLPFSCARSRTASVHDWLAAPKLLAFGQLARRCREIVYAAGRVSDGECTRLARDPEIARVWPVGRRAPTNRAHCGGRECTRLARGAVTARVCPVGWRAPTNRVRCGAVLGRPQNRCPARRNRYATHSPHAKGPGAMLGSRALSGLGRARGATPRGSPWDRAGSPAGCRRCPGRP